MANHLRVQKWVKRMKSGGLQFQILRSIGHMGISRLRVFLVIMGLIACLSLGPGLALAQDYQDSDFEIEVFDQDAISLQGNDRTVVVEALSALASNFPSNGLVDMELRQKALAIALRLDSLNASARATRQSLLSDRKPRESEYFEKLPAIHETLWEAAKAMKKSQEPEDQRLYPLLMELALVIQPDSKWFLTVEYVSSIEALADRVPVWKDFIPLNEGGKSKSSVRAENILDRGQKYKKKMGEMFAAKLKEAGASKKTMSAANNVDINPPNKSVTIKDGEKMPPKPEDQNVGTSAEVKVITWWRMGRMDTPMRLGKIMLNVRMATPDDADLFGNRTDNSMGSQSMRLVPGNRADMDMSWISYAYSVARDRHRNYPRGRVAELSFGYLENQSAPPDTRRYPNGQAIGTLLALEKIINNVELDPSVAVHGLLDQQQIRPAYGNFADAVDVAKEANLQLLVVSKDIESVTRDWIALGYLDRLLEPQIIGVSNIDEMVLAARSDKPEKVTEAINLFTTVKDIKTMSLEEATKNPAVQERLEDIISQFPQHLSAKMLLAYGKGGNEIKASLSGSVREIFSVLKPFTDRYRTAMIEDPEEDKNLEDMKDEAEERLDYLGNRVAEEAKDYLKASDKALDELVSYLRINTKTSTTAFKRREAAEEALVEMNEKFRELRDRVEDEEKSRRAGG